MQTQDSVDSLGLLLRELYDYIKAKSIIDADAVFPLLVIADKYNIKTILLRCTQWLNDINYRSLTGTLLPVSTARGKGTCPAYVCDFTFACCFKGRSVMSRDSLSCTGAGRVANALAWLTMMTRLADPAPLNPFKQLCIKVAADGVNWDYSGYFVCAQQPGQACLSFTDADALTLPDVCRWAELPLEVVLAVCRGLSARGCT